MAVGVAYNAPRGVCGLSGSGRGFTARSSIMEEEEFDSGPAAGQEKKALVEKHPEVRERERICKSVADTLMLVLLTGPVC